MKELTDILEEHLAILTEHFDVVQIMASSCDKEGTTTLMRGAGNHWARIGLAHEFINRDSRNDAAEIIAEKMHEHDD